MALTPEEIKDRAEYLKQLKVTEISDEEDFVFISYASADWKKVFHECVVPLQKKYNLRVYADKAFDVSNDQWLVPMQRNLCSAKVMLAFISKSYIESYACFLEMLTAVSNDIKIVFVFLEPLEGMKKGKTSDYPFIEEKVKADLFMKCRSLVTGIITYGTRFKEPMKNACAYLVTVFESGLSKYDISHAFINFLKGANIARKGIDDLAALQRSIHDECSTVFETINAESAPPSVEAAVPVVPSSAPTATIVKPETVSAPQPEAPSVHAEASPTATSSASVRSGEPERFGRNGNVLNYTIFGKTKTGKQSDIMYDIFEQAIIRYPEKYNDMLSLHCVSDKDYTKDIDEGKTQFRACRTFYTADGKVFCVGTSYGMGDKLKHIAKMMAICGIDRSELVIDGYSLPEKVSIPSGQVSGKSNFAGAGVRYELYGEQFGCKNQSEMMCRVFEAVINRHPDKITDVMGLHCVSETNYSQIKKTGAEIPAQFKAGQLIQAGGRSLYIGTAYNLNAKYKLILQLLSICGDPADVFRSIDI